MSSDEHFRPIVVLVAVVLRLPFLVALAWPMMGVWSGGRAWNGTADSVRPWHQARLPLLGLLLCADFYRAVFGVSSRETNRALEEPRVAAARDVASSGAFEERRERRRRERSR